MRKKSGFAIGHLSILVNSHSLPLQLLSRAGRSLRLYEFTFDEIVKTCVPMPQIPNVSSAICRGPLTVASRSPRNTLISVRTPKVSK